MGVGTGVELGVGVGVAGGVEGAGVGAKSPVGEGIGIGTGVGVQDIIAKTKAITTRASDSNFFTALFFPFRNFSLVRLRDAVNTLTLEDRMSSCQMLWKFLPASFC